MKKNIIWIIAVFILCSLASAFDTVNLTAYWNFNSNSTIITDSMGNFNGQLLGSLANVPGINGNGIQGSGVGTSQINISSTITDGMSGYTFGCWLNSGLGGGVEEPLGWGGDGGDSKGIRWETSSANQLPMSQGDGTMSTYTFNRNSVSTNWYLLVMAWDGSTVRWYVNGTSTQNSTRGFVKSTEARCVNTYSFFSRCSDFTEAFTGILDECFFYRNRALGGSDIEAIWNGGAGSFYNPSVVADILNISTIYPLNNTAWTFNSLSINTTVNATYNFNVSLYINSTLNETKLYSGGTDVPVIFNKNLPDGAWNFYFLARQQNDTTINETSQTNSIYVDGTLPTITANITSGIYTKVGKNLSIRFDFADNLMLWGYNISMNNAILNRTENLGVKTITKNITNSSWLIGGNNISVLVYDAHTAMATSIKEEDLSRVGDSLKVGDTTLTSLDKISMISYVKKIDRYNFCFYYDTPITIARLQMPLNCYYQNKENIYEGWFVCPDEKQWWDFENNEEFKISVKDNMVTAESEKPTDKFCFNSVGSLNQNSANYTIMGFNDSVYFNPSLIEGDSDTITLSLYSNDTSYTSSATLFWNGTAYPATLSSSNSSTKNYTASINTDFIPASVNITLYYQYTINSQTFNTSLFNQTVFHVGIDNCSSFKSQIINFSFYDDVNLNSIQATTTGLINVPLFSHSYPLSYTVDNSSAFCMYPNASIFSTYQFQFVSSGYVTKLYSFSEILSNATKFVPIYLTSAALNITPITTTLVDQSSFAISGYYVFVYKYDLATNNYTFIDSAISSITGKSIFSLINPTITQYEFRVYNPNGTLVFTQPKSIITDTSYTFTINLFPTVPSIIASLVDLNFNLSVNKATNNFTFIWDDSTNITDGIRLNIIQSNTTITKQLFNQATNNKSGILYYNVSGFGHYTANAYAISSLDGNEYLIDSISLDLRKEFQIFGTEALFMTFMFVGTIIFIGAYAGIEYSVIFGLLGLFIFAILGFINVAYSALIGLCVVGLVIIFRVIKRL